MDDLSSLWETLRTAAELGAAAGGGMLAWRGVRPRVDTLAERMDRAELRERARDGEIAEVRAQVRHVSRVVDRIAMAWQVEPITDPGMTQVVSTVEPRHETPTTPEHSAPSPPASGGGGTGTPKP